MAKMPPRWLGGLGTALLALTLVSLLLDLPATAAADAERYAAFRRRWCSLDDGHATDRVLDQLLEQLALRATDAPTGQPAGRFR